MSMLTHCFTVVKLLSQYLVKKRSQMISKLTSYPPNPTNYLMVASHFHLQLYLTMRFLQTM